MLRIYATLKKMYILFWFGKQWKKIVSGALLYISLRMEKNKLWCYVFQRMSVLLEHIGNSWNMLTNVLKNLCILCFNVEYWAKNVFILWKRYHHTNHVHFIHAYRRIFDWKIQLIIYKRWQSIVTHIWSDVETWMFDESLHACIFKSMNRL